MTGLWLGINLGLELINKFQIFQSQMPRRESARRNHPLARECDIIETLHMRLTLLQMTFGKHIERKHICFFPGEVCWWHWPSYPNILMTRFWTKSFASWTTSLRPTLLVGRTRWRTSCSTWAPWRWSTSRRTSSLPYLRLHISEAIFSSSHRRSPRPPRDSPQGLDLTPRCQAEPALWALHALNRPCPTILVSRSTPWTFELICNFQLRMNTRKWAPPDGRWHRSPTWCSGRGSEGSGLGWRNTTRSSMRSNGE